MIAVIQRVTQAGVVVDAVDISRIDRGVLALVAVEKNDTEGEADRLAERLLGFRLFPDQQDRMNLNVKEIAGGVLLVPQFTLAADTKKGTRPSFAPAAPPDQGRLLFHRLVEATKKQHPRVACGRFGANMQVSLTNDGPVTFILRAAPVGSP
jgi:D-aminoacyl-tRNA deacylase